MTDTTQDIKFVDPPVSHVRSGKPRYASAAASLMERTGEWALISTFDSIGAAGSLANRIKNSVGPWSGHRWDATTRQTAEHKVDVYAKHLGSNGEADR